MLLLLSEKSPDTNTNDHPLYVTICGGWCHEGSAKHRSDLYYCSWRFRLPPLCRTSRKARGKIRTQLISVHYADLFFEHEAGGSDRIVDTRRTGRSETTTETRGSKLQQSERKFLAVVKERHQRNGRATKQHKGQRNANYGLEWWCCCCCCCCC